MVAGEAWHRFGRPLLLLSFLTVAAVAVTLVAGLGRSSGESGPPASDYVRIETVPVMAAPPAAGPGASTGTSVSPCGRPDDSHHNGDNFVTMPGKPSGAHHTHDYVGNVSTEANSTERSLAAAPTTCRNGDRSSYYWPVLRQVVKGSGDHGPMLVPASVLVEYRGNPVSTVVTMPRFLRMVTGDPEALSVKKHPDARTAWSCTGYTNRHTTLYPICPPGSRLLRIFDFPSCWDGRHTDSPNHRAHVVFPSANGVCAKGFFPIPQLHIEVAYEVPDGAKVAVDSFPEQRRSPRTDHAGYVNVMTDEQMATVVACLNSGKHC